MSIIGSNILAGASGQGGGYTIENSLRFRSSASAYLNRTPASAGNRKTWTWSGWVKIGKASATGLFTASTSGSNMYTIQLGVGGELNVYAYAGTYPYFRYTSAVFRDYSAWYHFVVAFDSTQATDTDRIKIYVNGVLQTTVAGSGTGWPTLNYDGGVNNTIKHQFSENVGGAAYFDGYLTEVNFIDGQALTPSSFGKTNETTGVWSPIKFNGPWNVGTGVNGFYLPFSDATNTTTLVADSSGNGNDWTPNNISLTAGATYDSMTDTPTIYEDGGNYCVLNPLNKGTNQTIASGNLSNTASAHGTVLPTIGVTSGLWYAEVTLTTSGAGGIGFTINPQARSSYGEVAGQWWCYDNGVGFYIINQTTATASLATKFSAGQVWQWALDTTNGKLWIGLNNSWFSSAGATTGNPATGANPTFTFTAGTLIWPMLENGAGPVWNANFGQRPFAYTPPTGFLPMHTGNLPDSAIVDGSEYFNAVLWVGNGGTQSITGVGFQPDWLWVKERSEARSNLVWDAVRGSNLGLITNTTSDESAQPSFTGFLSDGFGVSNSDASDITNKDTQTYVAWNWKAGTAFSNDAGTNGATIASAGSVNQDAGFSIVTWTNPSSGVPTIGHGLGGAPTFIIVKDRTYAYNWDVGCDAIGWANRLNLNTTGTTSSAFWNSTAPTSTVFTYASSGANSGDNIVAYCFAEVEGYSKMGKWQNNNSTDGTFVYLGFRPRFILLKNYDNAESWYIWDSVRQTYNVPPPSNKWLVPNENYSEAANGATTVAIDGLSNGFKIRTTNPASGEISFGTRNYIYMAFAENPFKNSLAR
jgi:hypothetical protein